MNFQSRIERLGLTTEALRETPVERRIEVENIQQLRDVIDVHGTEEARRKRFEALFGGTPSLEDPQLRAAEEYVFGITESYLASTEAHGADPAFPLAVYVEAAEPLTISSEKDLSTPNGELRRAIYSTVTIKAGGYFVATSTPLDFICDELIIESDPPAGKGHFNILGRQGAAHGTLSKPPTPGQASPGASANCGSNKAGEVGHKATDGTPGGTGARGNDGIPSQLANIEVQKKLTVTVAVKLQIATQSGAGGPGQDGGAGGDAGQGGDGGPGVACGCGGLNGGPGRVGGTGGKGGKAGDGGNGVDAAANIAVSVPAADFTNVAQKAIASDAAPGKAGKRGTAGGAGSGGKGGSAGSKGSNKGAKGGKGAEGQIGDPGLDGTLYGKPAKLTVQPI